MFENRGYSILSTLQFIHTYDVPTRDKILDRLSPEVKGMIGKYKAIEWYPASHFSEMLEGIGRIGGGEDDYRARAELVRGGRFIANVAANTFLKLLMKIMTPSIFARKIPDLYQRDNRGGYVVSDLKDAANGHITFHFKDVGGYAHIAPIAVGWISFGMENIGKKGLDVSLTNWSLANPAPADFVIEMKWRQ
jgi:hypothetical protein